MEKALDLSSDRILNDDDLIYILIQSPLSYVRWSTNILREEHQYLKAKNSSFIYIVLKYIIFITAFCNIKYIIACVIIIPKNSVVISCAL